TACGSNVSVKDVEESTDELNTSLEEIVEANHQLNDLELTMDDQFSTVLAEDKELTTLQDESASVMENISERETTIENINDSIESINTQAETLRSEEHTSELQSRFDLVCRLLLE